MSEKPFTVPEHEVTAFNCPHCNAYSKQDWSHISRVAFGHYRQIPLLDSCCCEHCDKISIWRNKKMIYPTFSGVPTPNSDLSSEIKETYMEAASIFQRSPRGAAALLRLSIQLLCEDLGEKEKTIDKAIASLVNKGLDPKIQKALDLVRVVGNNSVHPGQLDMKDNVEVAKKLFGIINIIADTMITIPKDINETYELLLSEGEKLGIESRDKKKT